MEQFFKHILTGIDGESYDIGRVSWVISTFIISFVAYYMIYKGISLSVLDLGGALAANAAAHGGAIGLKAKTEPGV